MTEAQPIENHAVVGDLNTIALVALDGTIDFMCVPRFDSPSIFASLLDPERGGFFRLAPELDGIRHKQLYLPDSNSSTAALQRGEVDVIEQLPADYITPLRSDPNIRIGSGGSYQGFVVFNQTFPPFNDPKVRAAAVLLPPLPALLLGAVVLAIRLGRENRGANPNRLA